MQLEYFSLPRLRIYDPGLYGDVGDQKGNYYVLYGDTAVREARNIKSLLMWSNLKDIMLSNINQGTQKERLHNVT